MIDSGRASYDKTSGKAEFADNVTMRTVSGGVPLIMNCDSAFIDLASKEIFMKKVKITTCDLHPPHYHFTSGKTRLYPDRYISASNIIFYAGKIPVFYLPYYYKSFKNRPLKIELKPGYNRRDGFYVEGMLGYPLSENIYGKLYLDYFAYKGWGKGGEVLYSADTVNGSVYGYHIKEKDTGDERWNARLYHWQLLPHSWFAQINSNIMSDETFNDLYSGDWIRISRDIDSSVAFTKNMPQMTTRILFSRYDVFDSSAGVYKLQDSISPSVVLASSRIKIKKVPLYYSWSFNAERKWQSAVGDHILQSGGNINFTNPLRLSNKITMTSEIGLYGSWQERESLPVSEKKNIFLGNYLTDISWKIRTFQFLENTFGHHFEQGINRKNDEYHGVLVNKLRADQWIYLDEISVRTWAYLDLRTKLNENIRSLRNRLDGIITEAEYSPNKWLYLYFRNNYNAALRKPESNQISSEIRLFKADREAVYFRAGFSNERVYPGQVVFTGEVRYHPVGKWRLAYKNQTFIDTEYREMSLYELAFRVYRDLHCWEADFSYSVRNPSFSEFWFNIRLKPPLKKQDTLYPEDMETKWYPWR